MARIPGCPPSSAMGPFWNAADHPRMGAIPGWVVPFCDGGIAGCPPPSQDWLLILERSTHPRMVGHPEMGVGILRWVGHPEMGVDILRCRHPEMGAGILRCRHPEMAPGHPVMHPLQDASWHYRMRPSGRTSIRPQNSTPVKGRAIT